MRRPTKPSSQRTRGPAGRSADRSRGGHPKAGKAGPPKDKDARRTHGGRGHPRQEPKDRDRGYHPDPTLRADRPKAEPPAPLPPREKMPAVPRPVLRPTLGRMLWTGREGFEAQLYEELAWAGARPRVLGPAVVESDRLAKDAPGPTFARVGFLVQAVFESGFAADEGARWLAQAAGGKPLHLRGWTPDSDEGNRVASVATAAAETGAALLPEAQRAQNGWRAAEGGGLLGELCVLGPSLTAVGLLSPREALTLAVGGRQRMRREDAPSRAASKLLEAFDFSSLVPGKGDFCVDLGAAPGGWTKVLVDRGARVVAVDPANLSPELTRHRLVRHERASAFAFEPEEPCDFLLCDMVWRPIEVAQMLAKWGRRQWATSLIANLKLPMKDKLPVLHKARHLLEEGGWRNLKMRQLYHDRDEVTVVGQRGG